MRECLDEGILQSYFDGELSGERLKAVASHLSVCNTCTEAARELQAELNLLATALAPELEVAVPTEHLRQRIDAAIAGLQTQGSTANESSTFSVRAWFESFLAPLSFTPQRAFGYAGLVLVLGFAAVLGLMQWRPASPDSPDVSNPIVASNPPGNGPTKGNLGGNIPLPAMSPEVARNPSTPQRVRQNPTVRPQYTSSNNTVAKAVKKDADKVKLLPGERSYLQTIAQLDSTIKSSSNRPMRPALQAEYQRNLALVDRALAATRNAAKKNPNDPDAADFMFAAYENKVNLLNTVAEARTFNRQQD